MSDALSDILALARQTAPDVPAEVWQRVELAIRQEFGAERHYIARQPKKILLEQIADQGAESDCARLSKKLGISVRRAQQLRRLVR
jgi:hypothetical protein